MKHSLGEHYPDSGGSAIGDSLLISLIALILARIAMQASNSYVNSEFMKCNCLAVTSSSDSCSMNDNTRLLDNMMMRSKYGVNIG